jgi:hypothetical protein
MDQGQFEAKLAQTELRLKRLRQLYDQWFHGLERAEPQNQRLEVDRAIAELRREQIRNTALKFRLNQIVQRYVTYTTYWQRITRQIEEGTYKRDVLRARKRFGGGKRAGAERDDARPDAYELDIDVDVDVDGALEDVEDGEQAVAEVPADGSGAPASRPQERKRALREITPFALPSAEHAAAVATAPPSSGASLEPPGAASAPAAPARLPSGALGPSRPLSGPLVSRAPSGPLIVTPSLPAGPQASLRPKGAPPPVPAHVSRKPPPAPPRASLPAAPAGNGISDEQILSLYQRYVSARRDNRERTDNVRIETVAKTVREMIPKLREKHAGRQIDFEVVVKDGRVALKPVPK